MWQDIGDDYKSQYNEIVTHPLQSYEWGEFRRRTGVSVMRRGFIENNKIIEGFTVTIHKIPKTNFTIGYFPKGKVPSKNIIQELTRIGKEQKSIFIQLEPSALTSETEKILELGLIHSFHPLFTKYTFILDLSKDEEDLLKSLHSKTRYNIKVAKKHNVKVKIDNTDKAFKEYLKLTEETTKRQKFYAHTPSYHKIMWETLKSGGKKDNGLTAHLLKAEYRNETLATWILFVFQDHLYYPYGASSSKYRNVMSSNLIMWEAIRFGKKMGLSYFDMWGALEENPNTKDSWYGFHKFKEGYGAKHTEFAGSFDLVVNPVLYQAYKILDKTRWMVLRVKKFF